MDEGRKRVIGLMAAILASLHMHTADDLFGCPQGSPRTDKLIDRAFNVHHTQPAAAEFLHDAVMRDGLADHWGGILGLDVGQVNEAAEAYDAAARFGEYAATNRQQGLLTLTSN